MKIDNYREGLLGGNIVCEFDIELDDYWGTVYHNWKVIKSGKGTRFVASPSYGITTETGMKKYFPYIEMKAEKKREFDKKIMELLAEYVTF